MRVSTLFAGCVLLIASHGAAQIGWAQLADGPPARYGALMTYDPVRAQVVLFGGRNDLGQTCTYGFFNGWPVCSASPIGGGLLTDTWEWDGVSWTERFPATVPSASSDPFTYMTYDQARGVVLRFGGPSTSKETWEWDGNDWTQRTPATNPPGDAFFLVHDRVRSRSITVCWSSVQVIPAETWEWDGLDWVSNGLFPSTYPPVEACWDGARNEVIALKSGPAGAMETWRYAGGLWTQLFPATSIPPVSGKLVYDPVRQLVVYTAVSSGTGIPGGVWEWDGTTWSPATSMNAPPPQRFFFSTAYHEACQQMLFYGGQTTVNGTLCVFSCLPYTRTLFRDVWQLLPSGGGQANGVVSLAVSGFGPSGVNGPFRACVAAASTVSFAWDGPGPGLPYALAFGPPNPLHTSIGCAGALSIGTAPTFGDILLAIDGWSDPTYQLNANSTATLSVNVPVAVPPGFITMLQGAVGLTTGCGFQLTAAFEVLVR